MDKNIKYECLFSKCKETFDNRKQRSRHQVQHKEKGHKLRKIRYFCDCCNPPQSFKSAHERRNHEYYKKNKNKFECAKCHDTLSTKQKLQKHEANCSSAKGALKWVRKEAERESRELIETGAESDGEEDKHSNPGQEEMEPDTSCQDCNKLLVDERHDWWCPDCGYGLCKDCHDYAALNHVFGCTNKGTRTHRSADRNTHRERIKNNY